MTASIRRVASDDEMASCIRIRRIVFIEGQRVPEADEFDGLDPACTHFIALEGAEPVGTIRLRVTDEGAAKLERLAVLSGHRGRGIGSLLTGALEREARRLGHAEVLCGAQVQAVPFYEGLGYAAEGPVFDDAGIPHRLMRRKL
jgi:predicted GNAT family N-acyltransferase